MKVKDLMQLLHGPDRVRIIKDRNTVFTGWKDNWQKQCAIFERYRKYDIKNGRSVGFSHH